MPRFRRKLSASLNDLHRELDRLIMYDAENQRAFSASRHSQMPVYQLHMSVESIFNAAFRHYENFIREIFLLYCQEKKPRSGMRVRAYLKPKSFIHAEAMIKSSMPFLDWTSPDVVIARAELYLEKGFPVKLPYAANREHLRDLKKIRNHIAHNSEESLSEYTKVIRKHYHGVLPLRIPPPGEFLLLPEPSDPSKYKLLFYLEFLKRMADALT